MNNAAANIIEAMNTNIFSVARVDNKIMEEVPFFRKILLDNIDNPEVFHGYINKINETWNSILKSNFKKLISLYNDKYNTHIFNMIQRQNEMIRMAQDYNASQLFTEIDDLSLGSGINFLTSAFKSSGITKRKPSRKKR